MQKIRNYPGGDGIALFFRKNRKPPWSAVRIFTEGPKRRRKGFRIRHTEIFPRGAGKVGTVCSGFKKKRDGCRKHSACSDLKVLPRQIPTAYRLRWKTGIFHKHIKIHPGSEDVSAEYFSSAVSHVYPVYTAYILLHSGLPGIGEDSNIIIEKQGKVKRISDNTETAGIIHELTKIGGADRLKNELKSVPAA